MGVRPERNLDIHRGQTRVGFDRVIQQKNPQLEGCRHLKMKLLNDFPDIVRRSHYIPAIAQNGEPGVQLIRMSHASPRLSPQ